MLERMSPFARATGVGILRQWPNLSRQHDAAEFLAFLLSLARPDEFNGQWQARFSDAQGVHGQDFGAAFYPAPMFLYGHALQSCIEAWHSHAFLHAFLEQIAAIHSDG